MQKTLLVHFMCVFHNMDLSVSFEIIISVY